MTINMERSMLDFVKAASQADRLQIIGLLAQKKARLSEINMRLGFHPSDGAHHMQQLIRAGIVRRTGGFYTLDDETLESLARAQFEGKRRTFVPEPDMEEIRRRVLAAHLNPDGTLKTIPLQPSSRQVILEYLLNAFAVGENYTEKEVNGILARFHPDTAALRRYLFDAEMLDRERDGSRYWRPK